MPSQFQQAQLNLSNLTQPEYRYVAIWGFEHLLTNGSVKRLDEHNISYVQLKPAHFTFFTNDYETDCEEYYTDINVEKIKNYLTGFTYKILPLSPL
jgi:hypothetical protein